MNKTISTRTGIITALSILFFIIVLERLGVPNNSPIVFFQFLILFVGLFITTFFLFKYYTGIKFIESFTHCLRTLATILVLLIFGNTILFFMLSPHSPISNLTFLIMKTIFAFGLSGLLSAFFWSYIFTTFTKK